MTRKLRSVVLPAVAAIASTALGFPEFAPYAAAATSGGQTYAQTHNLGQSLASAGGSFVGSNIGGALLGDTGGTVGNALQSTIGQSAANAIGPSLGGNIVGANLGSFAGNALGGNIGGDVASSLFAGKGKPIATPSNGASPFSPSQQPEKSLPLSLQGNFGSLTDQQRGSGIATQGVYGGGNGPEENAYYLNLINRRLVDQGGHVASDLSGINPVENSYLSQLGLGGKSNPTDLLQAIQGWHS